MTKYYFSPTSMTAPVYGAHPDDRSAARQDTTRPSVSRRPLPSPASTPQQLQRKASRERGSFIHQMSQNNQPAATPPYNAGRSAGYQLEHDREELFMSVPQRNNTSTSMSSVASSQPSFNFSRTNTASTASSLDMHEHAPMFGSMDPMGRPAPRPSENAMNIEAFTARNHDDNAAFGTPQIVFEGETRRLTPASERALQHQYQQLAPLRRQVQEHLANLERPALREELAGMGRNVEALEADLQRINARCGDAMDTISRHTAQSMIPIPNDRLAQWVGKMMMGSPQSRQAFDDYLRDQPLQLKVKINQLEQLSVELGRIPSPYIAPEYAQRRDELQSRMNALHDEITVLRQAVGGRPLPNHITATAMNDETVVRHLAEKYETVRPHLHQLRDSTAQLLHQKKGNRAEQRELRALAEQIHKTLENQQNLENYRTGLQIEDAHARGQTPYIAYSPEAAVSLDTRLAFYGGMSTLPTVPVYPDDLRQLSEAAAQKYQYFDQVYQHQRHVERTEGRAMHPSVIPQRAAAELEAKQARENYDAAKATYDREHAQWRERDATARKYQSLMNTAKTVQYTMLDDKVNTLIMDGFAALRDAPEPKPKAGEIDKLRSIYHSQRDQLGNAASTAAMRAQLDAKLKFLDKA